MVKKNNILVVLNKGFAELDWLMPILFAIKKNFNIFFFFNSKKSFENLKGNKQLYSLFEEIKSEHYIKKYSENLIFRLIRSILLPFKNFKCIFIINKYLNNKINNVFKFKNKNSNFKISFFEYGANSGIPTFLRDNTDTKIIYYPLTGNPLTTDKQSLWMKKIRIIGDIILVNSTSKKYSENFKGKKIIHLGNPKFENWWLKKFIKSKRNRKNKSVMFAYNAHRHVDKEGKEKLKEQLFDTMKVINSINNLNIFFKIHPVKNNPYYLDILKKFSNQRLKISKEHILNLSDKSNVVITPHGSAALLDGIVSKKPSIAIFGGEEFEPPLPKNKSDKKIFVNNVIAKNKVQFEKFLKIGLNKPNNIIWKKQYKNFRNFFHAKSISEREIRSKFNQLIK